MGVLEGRSEFVEGVAHVSLHSVLSLTLCGSRRSNSFLAAVPPQHRVLCHEALLHVAVSLGEDFPPAHNQTLGWLNLK